MGLTFDFTLRCPTGLDAEAAVRRVHALVSRHLPLPAEAAGPVRHLVVPDARQPTVGQWFATPDVAPLARDALRAAGADVGPGAGEAEERMLVRASLRTDLLSPEAANSGTLPLGWDAPPQECFAFDVAVGPGADSLCLGLGRYPAAVMRAGRMVATGHDAARYTWYGFVKTAGTTAFGLPAFVRAHSTAIAVLDAARAAGLLVEVHDPSGFWEQRDPFALAVAGGADAAAVARMIGRVEAQLPAGTRLRGAVPERRDFERLEMATPASVASDAASEREAIERAVVQYPTNAAAST
jgi:hypothetical protein